MIDIISSYKKRNTLSFSRHLIKRGGCITPLFCFKLQRNGLQVKLITLLLLVRGLIFKL